MIREEYVYSHPPHQRALIYRLRELAGRSESDAANEADSYSASDEEAAVSSRNEVNWIGDWIEGFWFWVFHTLRIPNPAASSQANW
jgi:hypothetical protein